MIRLYPILILIFLSGCISLTKDYSKIPEYEPEFNFGKYAKCANDTAVVNLIPLDQLVDNQRLDNWYLGTIERNSDNQTTTTVNGVSDTSIVVSYNDLTLGIYYKLDTIEIEYQDKESLTDWKKGFMVTHIRQRDEVSICFDEPVAWLDADLKTIEEPLLYTIKL